jgi:hypothetical protein
VPKVQVQFHADPREAVSLGLRWARQHDLRAVLEQFFPVYRAVEPSGDDPSATGMEVIDRVALCRADPDLTATTAHEFVSRNPGCLFLSIGSHGDDWLRESALGGVTEEQETLRIWRLVPRRLFQDTYTLPVHTNSPREAYGSLRSPAGMSSSSTTVPTNAPHQAIRQALGHHRPASIAEYMMA